MARQRHNKQPPGQRLLRVGEEIRHILAEVFERETFRDPALSKVKLTVTEVRPSPDLRHARVYVVPLGGGDTTAIMEGLKRVKPFLKRCVAESVSMKFVPDLVFASDTTFDEAEHIATLLHRPEVARDLKRDVGDDDDVDNDDDSSRRQREEE